MAEACDNGPTSDSSEDSDDSQTLSSYDSEEFADVKTFSLNHEDMDKCLRIMHYSTAKNRKNFHKRCQTSTSRWSRVTSIACAAYKIFKVKRWLLTNVNLVFDPLNRDSRLMKVSPAALLWTEKSTPDASGDAKGSASAVACVGKVTVKTLSVDGMLSKVSSKFEGIMKLDEVMKEVDDDFDLAAIQKTAQMLPPELKRSFMTFIYTLKHAMILDKTGGKTSEAVFQNIFLKFVECVLSCLGAGEFIDCTPTVDGVELDKLKLRTYLMDGKKKDIVISSKPDLYLYQRVPLSMHRRVIAVIEVKGKAGEHIIHSDDEDEDEFAASSPDTLGVLEEESEEELPLPEKIKMPRHSRMKRLQSESRRYTRKFLPQLIGEMLCCRGTNGLQGIMRNTPDSTFGIAVIGFDVYFVTMVTTGIGEEFKSGLRHSLTELFNDPEIYTNVFITRPFNLCNRSGRRTILKVLSAACFVDDDYILDQLAKLKI